MVWYRHHAAWLEATPGSHPPEGAAALVLARPVVATEGGPRPTRLALHDSQPIMFTFNARTLPDR